MDAITKDERYAYPPRWEKLKWQENRLPPYLLRYCNMFFEVRGTVVSLTVKQFNDAKDGWRVSSVICDKNGKVGIGGVRYCDDELSVACALYDMFPDMERTDGTPSPNDL